MKRNCVKRMVRFTFLGLLLSFSSCAILEEGCLDVYATNFAVEVDKPCAVCCTYPQIRIDLLHKIAVADSLQNLTTETAVYADGAGNPLRIQDIRFYVSGVHLLRSDGTEVAVEETITLKKTDGSSVTVENNFGLWTPATLARFIPGTFRKADEITSVRLTLGVGKEVGGVLPESAPSTHALYPKTIPMWTSTEGFITQRLAVYPGDTGDTAMVYELTGEDAMQEVELNLPAPLAVAPGHHITLVIQLDYSSWLSSIDIKTESSEVIESKLKSAFLKSIKIIQAKNSEA